MAKLSELDQWWADVTIGAESLGTGSVTTAKIAANAVTSAKLSVAAGTKGVSSSIPTIATTGATEVIVRMPMAGTITGISVTFKESLTADDTNFLTFTAVNKGGAGGGSTALLASTPAGTNTTKATGGSGLTGYVPATMVLTATSANLVVATGDVITFVATNSATLAHTETEGHLLITYIPSG